MTIPRAIPVVSSAVAASPGETPTPSQVPQSSQTSSYSPPGAPNQVELGKEQVNPAEEASILSGTPQRRLTVGGMAAGVLTTPVIWAGARGGASAVPEKFVVQLDAALTDKDGQITLPQGTQIVAAVVGVNESGLAQLNATQAVVDGQEYVLPPGAICIRGNDGQPLMARKWGDKQPVIANGEATEFLLGALSKVGQVLTQPNSQSSTSISGIGISQSSTSQSGGRNLLGAVLDGGLTPIEQQILQRQQQQIQELSNRPNVWYVPAGSGVQVFVNQSFEF